MMDKKLLRFQALVCVGRTALPTFFSPSSDSGARYQSVPASDRSVGSVNPPRASTQACEKPQIRSVSPPTAAAAAAAVCFVLAAFTVMVVALVVLVVLVVPGFTGVTIGCSDDNEDDEDENDDDDDEEDEDEDDGGDKKLA